MPTDASRDVQFSTDFATVCNPQTNDTAPTAPASIDPFSLPTTFERITALIAQKRFDLMADQLVARIDIQQTYGSLLLPDVAQNETNTATIVVAADNLDAELFAPGRKVLPIQHEGRELCSKGNERLVLYDATKDLHAVFVDDSYEV
jgi:hypothetical protein